MKYNYKAFACVIILLLNVKFISAQSNLQKFTPSILLQKGQLEFNLFNSLYSQTKKRDRNGKSFKLGERQSFLRNTFSLLYGISKNKRINIGTQANLTTARYTSPKNSILSIFGNETGDYKKTILSSIGFIIKVIPFKNIGFLSIQNTLLFPVNKNLETPRFIDHNRISWLTQIFLDKSFNDKWRIFLEIGLLNRFKKLNTHQYFFRVPFSAIISYFPSSKTNLFATFQYMPAFGKKVGKTTSKFGQLMWFTALGLGAKYQVSNNIGLELSYNNFILSREDGAGNAINFGIRIIK